jgi:hypothetical protein
MVETAVEGSGNCSRSREKIEKNIFAQFLHRKKFEKNQMHSPQATGAVKKKGGKVYDNLDSSAEPAAENVGFGSENTGTVKVKIIILHRIKHHFTFT